uniref:O-fucosyltransferase family protein n=1 Tax=Salix viminalis TaxID=40686 RepID=A0A6N2N079_SALVM
MKGEGKMVIMSKMKWVGLIGLVLSAFSLVVHFLLARYTVGGISDYQSSVTIFSWRPIFENPEFAKNSPLYRRLWGQVRRLESFHPDANPRGYYADPRSESSGYVFVRIQGGFHEIRNSICDVVAISRLLNATLVIPEIQSTTSSKGIRRGHVPAPIPEFIIDFDFWKPCTAKLTLHLSLGALPKDVHTELIQHKRAWMKKRGIVKGKLSVNSAKQRLNGSCPLMPEEVGILLRAYGYSWDTILYISGGEVFGGQRTLIPLHAMFENTVDRTSLSAAWELSRIYGREVNLIDTKLRPPPLVQEKKLGEWKNAGLRPHPLPPPPARPKYPHNIEGWWGWVAESDNEPESTVMELRTNAHKLLWEAIDYLICVEADVFIPGTDGRTSKFCQLAPECSCLRYDPNKPVEASLGVMHSCPKWMDSEIQTQSKDKETEEDSDEDVSSSSGLFFKNIGGNNQNGGGELMKEESQLDDQEEIEGAD